MTSKGEKKKKTINNIKSNQRQNKREDSLILYLTAEGWDVTVTDLLTHTQFSLHFQNS